jgi:hypothetical protein
MGKRLTEADGAPRAVAVRKLALSLLLCLIVAGCAGVDYRPAPDDGSGPIHGDSGGGGGGGGGM